MKWTEKITRFAVKNRKSPAENRRIVGKYISFGAVILFVSFWLILRLSSEGVVNLERI